MNLIDRIRKEAYEKGDVKMSLQEDIITQLGVKPKIDAQEEIRKSIDFLKAYMKKHGF